MPSELPRGRWVEDPGTSPGLRALLEQARSEIPGQATMAEFGSRLDASIAAGALGPEIAPPLPGAAGTATISAKSVLIVAGIAAGGLVSGGLWVSRHSTDNASAFATAAISAAATSSSGSATTAAGVSSNSDVPFVSAPQSASAGAAKTMPKATEHRDSLTEPALLRTARSALTSDPARALSLTEEHARRFPDGALVQEREVIAIEALQRMGQHSLARRRGTEFERRFPGSAHHSKLEQTLKAK